jgi:hypothetical protein
LIKTGCEDDITEAGLLEFIRSSGSRLESFRCDSKTAVTANVVRALMEKCPWRFTKVTIARHAQSEGNVKQVYQGQVPGTPLTSMGKEQAKKLAESIGKDMQRVAAIYASPLLRTQETAVAIAKKTGADVTTDERLREVGFVPART